MTLTRNNLAAALICLPPLMSLHAQSDDLLARARDHQRPVLIFGRADDPRVEQEFHQFVLNASATRDRDIVIYFDSRPGVLPQLPPPGATFATPAQQAALQNRFHVPPDTFTLILIGKDGGEKFRSTQVVPFSTLAAIIDGMPMRQQEMHNR